MNESNETLQYYLSDKDIEGVYEMNIPLSFRFISDYSDVVKPRIDMIGLQQSALQRDYIPKEFTNCSDQDIEFDQSMMNKIHFYHVHTKKKHFFAIFSEKDMDVQIITVCLASKPNSMEAMRTQFKKDLNDL